jgi:hypothetical protein
MTHVSQLSQRVLFLSWSNENCGVHQYGKGVAAALGLVHQSITSLDEAESAIARYQPDVTLWNWHPGTLGRIVHPCSPRRFRTPSICLLHEFDPHLFGGDFFDVFVMPDPTNTFQHPRFFTSGRAIVSFTNSHPQPSVPTIGSFGFGVGIKGYQRLIGLVRESYDEAMIRLHIPANWAVDPNGYIASQLIEQLRVQSGAGISIEASQAWLDSAGLLDWLAKNTINVFPYDPVPHPGISSSTDWALAARRPIAITHCGLFKHLTDLPICLESYSIKEIVERGTAPIEHLWECWGESNFRDRWSVIVSAALNYATKRKSQPQEAAPAEIIIDSKLGSVQRFEKVVSSRHELVNQPRLPIPGGHSLTENNSQAWQDFFVTTVLRGKKNGLYLEFGADDPRIGSNTYRLSEMFGWSGVSVDSAPSHLYRWACLRPDHRLLIADALTVDYAVALPLWYGNGSHRIDYLKINKKSGFNFLQVLNKLPLNTFRFSVITFGASVYVDDMQDRQETRDFLKCLGYEMVASDVAVPGKPGSPGPSSFEDWWVDPTVIDREIINEIVRHEAARRGLSL